MNLTKAPQGCIIFILAILLGCSTNGPVAPGIDDPPTAAATVTNPEPYLTGMEITFDASASYDNDNQGESIISYEWDWENDGVYDWATASPITDHVYENPGNYEIQLRVADNEFDTDTLDEPLEITVLEPGTPVAVLSVVTPEPFLVGETIEFDASGSYDTSPVSVGIVDYAWDWENDWLFDESGPDPTATHVWNDPGPHEVQLRVKNSENRSAVLAEPLTVNILTSDPHMPVAQVVVQDPPLFVYRQIFFEDDSFDPDGGTITRSEWDWDNDGIYETLGNSVWHSWDSPGVYNVQHRVTDDEGFTDTLDEPLEVVIDAGIPDNPVEITPPWFERPPHYILIQDNIIYANTTDIDEGGFYTIDASNPVSLRYTCFIECPDDIGKIASANGFAYTLGGGNLQIIDVDPPQMAHYAGIIPGVNGNSIVTEGQYIYVANYDSNSHKICFIILDASDPGNPFVTATYLIPETSTYEFHLLYDSNYFYILAYDQLFIVDKQDPLNLELIASFELDNYYYQAYLSPGTSCIFLRRTYSPNMTVFGIDYDNIQQSQILGHFDIWLANGGDIEIDQSGKYIYVADHTRYVKVLDVQDVTNPVKVHEIKMPYITEDVSIDGNRAYIGPYIYDITNPSAPFYLACIEGSTGNSMCVDGDYVYFANYFADITAMEIVKPWFTGFFNSIFIHGEPTSIDVSEGLALVFFNSWEETPKLVDVSTPHYVHVYGSIPGKYYEAGRLSGGYAYVSYSNGNMHIYDVEPPESYYLVKEIKPGTAYDIEVSGGYAYLLHDTGMKILDIDPPEGAHVVYDFLPGYNFGPRVVIQGDWAYTICGYNMLILNVNPPETTSVVQSIFLGSTGYDIEVMGGYAYVICGQEFKCIDIHDPYNPFVQHSFPISGTELELTDNYALINNSHSDLRIVRLW